MSDSQPIEDFLRPRVAPSLMIVPDSLKASINTLLDEALAGLGPEAEADREHLYSQLLDYFDQHGSLPSDISVERA